MAPRLPEEPHVNIEVRGEANVEAMEKKLLDEINSRNKDGKIEVHKDAGFAENPMDREDITGGALTLALTIFVSQKIKHLLILVPILETIGVDQVKGFSSILAGLKETSFPGLTMVRVPFRCFSSAIAGWLINNLCFSEQRAVPESNFDVIVKALSSENAATTQVSELDC